MEEKKTNQFPEIKDEELDQVAGGRGNTGTEDEKLRLKDAEDRLGND